VTGGGHQKKDHEGEESKLLKGKLREAGESSVGRKQADEGVLVAQTVKLNDAKNSVNGPHKKSRHTQMPPVVKKGQEPRIQPAERSNTQNDMKQQKCRGTSGTNE